MTPPLASIIGSEFLVLGPILDAAYGKYAPLVMSALCLPTYGFGSAIRLNIATIARHAPRDRLSGMLETASSWSLGFAYMISVAYYLNLFGAFGVSLTPLNDPLAARMLTTTVFLPILSVGWVHGFRSLERMEYISVSIKLAVIAGLLVGVALYFWVQAGAGALVFNQPDVTSWPALTLAFGLIVTAQGFETSRYFMAEYDAATRIRSMRWAQLLSSAIYMIYIPLLAYLFQRGELVLSKTAIIDLMQIVAPILPVLLVGAALAAQFSAAVADTGGSGGLIAEQSGHRLSPRVGYVILTGIGLLLTWRLDVFQIIGYASRAFALYYALQSAIAASVC